MDDTGDLTISDVMSVADEGASLIVVSPAPSDAVVAIAATACVLEETGAPATIMTNMGSTSAMMGRQSSTYEGITVQWTYSAGTDPGSGFQATFDDPEA